jgi:hypothetical protein
VEGAGEREGVPCDPEPGSDSTVIEEVGDLGAGIDGDVCLCRVALLFAGVDGREADPTEEAFAEGPLVSLDFQDVGSTSGISGVAGVMGRGRVALSPRRVDRTAEAPIAPGPKLVEDAVMAERSWDDFAHEAERGSRAMRI